ncbi:hypothetical protein [Algoriphagus boritolerans]|uniref:hypothetical protein n=1 Tax=Algoriphagus boritolerans TaxID=308111 RepID=UPI000B0922D2
MIFKLNNIENISFTYGSGEYFCANLKSGIFFVNSSRKGFPRFPVFFQKSSSCGKVKTRKEFLKKNENIYNQVQTQPTNRQFIQMILIK